MLEKWVESLVDPEDSGSLRLTATKREGDDIVEGSLVCEKCDRTYHVTGGVPRFVDERHYKSTDDYKDEIQKNQSFSYKWWQFIKDTPDPQIHRKLFEEQFLTLVDAKNTENLKDVFKDGARCLDAGCGVGWSEYLFNVNPATDRYGFDITTSVDIAHDMTKDAGNVFFAQADIFKPPFKEGYFDVIFSNGVLHHTGDTRAAFKSLCRLLKPGGLISVYIYNIKPFLRELADERVRQLTTDMNGDECMSYSKQMTALGRALKACDQKLVIDEDIPILGVKRGQYELQKFIYDHFIKCYYNAELGFEASTIVNFDWYHPKIASHHTRAEIEGWFAENNIGDVSFRQPAGWEHSGYFASGRKAD